MKYVLYATIIIVCICIGLLVTQSRLGGILAWILVGVGGMLTLLHKRGRRWRSIVYGCVIWIVSTGLVFIRVGIHDDLCLTVPEMLQGSFMIDQVREPGKSYSIVHDKYTLLYRTNEILQRGDMVQIYSFITKIYPCLSQTTPFHVMKHRILTWVAGGDFDYHVWLTMKGFHGMVQGGSIIQGEEAQESQISYQDVINTHRQELLDTIGGVFTGNTAGWVAGTLIGDKTLINNDDYDILIDSGLVHLIVVSGGNLALVIMLLGRMMFRIPTKVRYGCIIIGLCMYVSLVGTDSSILRALVMALLTILGTIFGYKVSFRILLCCAISALLIYNPYMLFDVGLWLSIGAIIGIYIVYHRAYYRMLIRTVLYPKVIQNFILIIAASIGAWMGTLPVLVRQFGSANLSSIVANIVVGIFASITMIGEIIVLTLYMIIPSSVVVQRGIYIIHIIVQSIYTIAYITVSHGIRVGATSWWGYILIWGTMVSLLVILYYYTQKRKIAYYRELQE